MSFGGKCFVCGRQRTYAAASPQGLYTTYFSVHNQRAARRIIAMFAEVGCSVFVCGSQSPRIVVKSCEHDHWRVLKLRGLLRDDNTLTVEMLHLVLTMVPCIKHNSEALAS
jgi:hypothetical protein